MGTSGGVKICTTHCYSNVNFLESLRGILPNFVAGDIIISNINCNDREFEL